MKLATILPTAYLGLIEDKDYHMALAHLVEADAEYTEFYKQQSAKGSYVIMDNGVVENAQQSIDTICHRAVSIGAQEIILPDVFMETEATLESSLAALEYVRAHYPKLKVMVVPQGLTVDQWLDCAEIMLSWGVDCIGVPKVLTHLGGRDGRIHALVGLKQIMSNWKDTYGSGIDIHLLGCWESPIECTMIEKAVASGALLPVRGCDSAIAFVYTEAGKVISEDVRPKGHVKFEHVGADLDLLQKNIAIWEASVKLDRGTVISIL